jgi:hypothetical protein
MIHHVRIRARKRACPEPNRAGTLILDYQSPELWEINFPNYDPIATAVQGDYNIGHHVIFKLI